MCHRPVVNRRNSQIAGELLRSLGTPDMLPAANKAGKRMSISFSESVLVGSTTSLNDYTDDEYFACWYSPEEYDTIENEMMEDFKKMEDGLLLGNNSSSRGLEQYLAMNAVPRKQNVQKSIAAVLDEQDRQFELEDYSDEAISEAYRNVSSSCLMWAIVIGRRDEHEAMCAHDEDEADDMLALNHGQHDGTESFTTLLKGVIGTKLHEPSKSLVLCM